MSALGRFLITKKKADIASFKTPNLRNVLITAPYFHDGSQQTLWDVVDHYNKGDGLQNPYLDDDIQPLALTEGTLMTLSLSGVADKPGLQGFWYGRAWSAARTFALKSPAARYGPGLRPETTKTQATEPLSTIAGDGF